MCISELAWVAAHFVAGISPVAGGGHQRVVTGDFYGDKESGNSCRRVFLCVLILLFTGSISPVHAEVDFAGSYARLAAKVKDHWDEPPDSENSLSVWLNWIGIKAGDRDEVQDLLDKANQLYIQNPGNEEYNQWTQKLQELWQKAQDSGTSTVNGASMKFIRLKDNEENWENALKRVKEKGRRIFAKAEQSGFSTEYPRGRSKCLINFALGDIESSDKREASRISWAGGHGGSLYRNRLLVFGYRGADGNMRLPDRDFVVMCEGRSSFTRQTEGEPDKTIAWAFEFVGMIQSEAEWWAFEREKQDATDLMNQYYEDALCKIPPHKAKEGHKYFLDLAKEKELDDSIEYNEGFYATLYGKVEVLWDGVREPAAGAKVTVDDLDETWTVKMEKYSEYPDHRKGMEGRTIVERDVYSAKVPLVTSPSFELKGTYTRGKKGNDQLQASYQESRTLPSTVDKTPGFVSRYREIRNLPPLELKCPGRKVTNNASFSLTRKRVK